jgi:hypothetical protein
MANENEEKEKKKKKKRRRKGGEKVKLMLANGLCRAPVS